MRVPVSWLREYVTFDVSLRELADRLAVTTCEVERISRHGVADADGNLGLFRVGRVVEAGKHPNADRLQLCRVDVGEAEPRQIVCGAWNFGAGATVAVALPGAVLPDGTELKQAKLRGETSDGMILSESELELSQDHEGILVLADGPEPGTPLGDVLPLGDDVLEIEVTGNRPDLLAVYGIAREVAAVVPRAELPAVPRHAPTAVGDEHVDVTVESFEAARATSGASSATSRSGESPPWLKARLTAAGMRSISNVVDVTNYVMLALGSPLHAFDFDTLAGGKIVVRPARSGETLRTLDGTERKLDRSVPRDRRRGEGRRARRDHGRRGDGGATGDDEHPPRGRELRADRHPRELRAARASHRRLEPLGEGRRPVPGRAGGRPRDRAARGADRRAARRVDATCRPGCRTGPSSTSAPSARTR